MDNEPKPISRQRTLAAGLATLATVFVGAGTSFPGFSFKRKLSAEQRHAYAPKEPCKQCGKLKHHKNDFCSRECCHAYRKK